MAQETPKDSLAPADRCIRWINATEPNRPMLDPVNFCSGFPTGNAYGLWASCHPSGDQPGDPAPGVCGFIGYILPGDTLAINVRTASRDGHEFFSATSYPTSEQLRTGATFYSRTPFYIGKSRLPGGLYKLYPYLAAEGWTLAIAEQSGEWNASIGDDENRAPEVMNPVAMEDRLFQADKLVVQFWPFAKHCPGSRSGNQTRELEFAFGEIDLAVCVSPDR